MESNFGNSFLIALITNESKFSSFNSKFFTFNFGWCDQIWRVNSHGLKNDPNWADSTPILVDLTNSNSSFLVLIQLNQNLSVQFWFIEPILTIHLLLKSNSIRIWLSNFDESILMDSKWPKFGWFKSNFGWFIQFQPFISCWNPTRSEFGCPILVYSTNFSHSFLVEIQLDQSLTIQFWWVNSHGLVINQIQPMQVQLVHHFGCQFWWFPLWMGPIQIFQSNPNVNWHFWITEEKHINSNIDDFLLLLLLLSFFGGLFFWRDQFWCYLFISFFFFFKAAFESGI